MFFQKKRIYLDFAASAPVCPSAHRAFEKALKHFGNPSSPHEEGRRAHAILSEARQGVARVAGVKPDAVIFTSGATESNALCIRGAVRALLSQGRASRDIHLLYSPSAHASVRKSMEALAHEGVVVEPLSLLDGHIDIDALSRSLRDETALIAVDLVCNETGMKTKTRDIRRVIDERYKGSVLHPKGAPRALEARNVSSAYSESGMFRARPLLHVDASQAPFVESVLRTHALYDTMSLDAQKIGGVRGCGVLIAPRTLTLLPLWEGGGQERGLRSGTESIALASAFAQALADASRGREAFTKRAQAMRLKLLAKLTSALADLQVNEGESNAPHILNVSLQGRDTDYLVLLLDTEGFAVSTRSACETDESYSRAVKALCGDTLRAKATVRISFGPSTKDEDLQAFSSAFIHAVAFLDAHPI